MDPLNLPPAPCDLGAAVADLQAEVGELVAVQTTSDGFDETSTVERTAAVLEVEPLLPCCDIGAAGLQAMIMPDPCIVDEQFSGVYSPNQGLLEDDSGSGVGPLGVEMQDVDCLSGIRAYIDGVHGAVIIDRAECYDFSPVVEAKLEEIFHNIEQVFSVVNSPKKVFSAVMDWGHLGLMRILRGNVRRLLLCYFSLTLELLIVVYQQLLNYKEW